MDTNLAIQPLSPSDWIAIASISVDVMAMIVGGFLAVWVVQSIQSKLDAEQKLREYFFSEVLDIRKANREVMQDVYNHCVKAKDFTKRMSTINKLTTELMNRLKLKYHVDDQELLIYQSDLNDKVSNRREYALAFQRNQVFQLAEDFEMELREFEATNGSKIFNDILLKLYES